MPFQKGHPQFNTGRTHFKKGCISLMKGKKHSEETKQKMRLAHKGKKLSEEHKKNMSIIRKGKKRPPFSEKWKRNLSLSHIGKYLGKDSPSWKGGRYKTPKGYVYIYKPSHPFCNKMGYVAEHRLVIENHIGRYLILEEKSHHINKIKTDNRIKNLMAFINQSVHRRFHINPSNVKPSEIIFDGRKI